MKSLYCGFVLLPLLYVTILLEFPGVRCEINVRQLEKRVLDNLTKDSNYDERIRPNGVQTADGPVVSNVNLFIRSISNINQAAMEYSIQVTFRQMWRDSRLQYDDFGGKLRYLTLTDHYIIWKPDLFFSNEREGHIHNLIMPNYLLRIYPSGQVLYSLRMSLVLSCPMDLSNFPLDTQTCSMIMASYGYTTEDLIFLWKDDNPLQITKNLHLPSFTLIKFSTDYCTSRTNTGEYSCLKVDLVFKRVFSYYLYQFYMPFCTFVILSWITFWIDKNQIAVRICLSVAALLAMSFLSWGLSLPLPQTSYIKAIDVWSGVCHLFAFSALLEFALVIYIHRRSRQHNADKESTVMESVKLVEMEPDKKSDFNLESRETRKLNWWVWIAKLLKRSSKIDILSRIVFPISFVIFNVIYWTTYSSRYSEKYH